MNADGYEYTHTTYRLWRKNRNPNSGSSCVGTDLNRNFDFKWRMGGSSDKPCSDIYAGVSGNSELETKAVVAAINKKAGQWDAFLSLHSYGNWWLSSWGHSAEERPDDYQDLIDKEEIGAQAIKNQGGSVFKVGSSASLLCKIQSFLFVHFLKSSLMNFKNFLDVNTGSSIDWAKGVADVKYTYVLELRPGQGTEDLKYGFALPEDRMPAVATETYAGMKAFLNSI